MSAAPSAASRRAWLIFALLCLAYGISYFHRIMTSTISVDMMNDFQIGPETLGFASSATMLGYAFSQIPAGILADTVGTRKTLAVFQLAGGILCLAFGLSSNWTCVVISRFLLGFVLAANVPGLKVLAMWFPPSMYSKVSGLLISSAIIGKLLMGYPLVFLASLWTWRGATVFFGLVTFALGICSWLLIRDTPPDAWQPRAGSTAKKMTLREAAKIVLRMKNYWFILLWFVLIVAVQFALMTMWWGSYFLQGCGMTKMQLSAIFTVMAFATLPVIPLFAVLSDNVFHSRKNVLILGSVIITAGLLWFALKTEQPGFTELLLVSTIINTGIGASCPLCFTMVKESVPQACMASSFGLLNSGAPVLTSVINVAFGFILSKGLGLGLAPFAAYGKAFFTLAAVSTAALLICLPMKDTYRAPSASQN
ncbi:MAG: MFS transporter [Desulfovibrionaceae bacterium]|nr:MFS transporter [Desulfovibrionaceae bacterium]